MPRPPLLAALLALCWPAPVPVADDVVPDTTIDFAPPRILAPPVRWWRS